MFQFPRQSSDLRSLKPSRVEQGVRMIDVKVYRPVSPGSPIETKKVDHLSPELRSEQYRIRAAIAKYRALKKL